MTEAEWLQGDITKQLLVVQHYASIRKLRLIAAAFVRQLQLCPSEDEAKRCDDLIEAAAEAPRPWDEVAAELEARPGNWRFTHILVGTSPDEVAKAFRKLVHFAPAEQYGHVTAFVAEVVGNPFRRASFDPAWRAPAATTIAQAAYAERELPSGHLDTARLAVLSDALEEAGCIDEAILDHLRSPGPHVRGCWALDLVLGKA